MKDISDKLGGRFKTAMGFMIAFVTVMSAVAAWRAALAAGDASNADVNGLAATINLEESQALNSLTAYEHYRAFTAYLRYTHLGDLLYEDMQAASDADYPILDRQRGDDYALAVELQGQFFPSRYLDPDSGNYQVAREINALVADDERDRDINPAPHFTKADELRTKSNYLVAVLVAFAIALWFFSLAESMRHAFKYALAVSGLVFTGIGVLAILAVELFF